MKVFISWSGNRSVYVAKHLCDWLKNVIQTLEPWISKHIEIGATWATELAEELETTDFGIACVTPENQFAPWLLFEAGAISKKTTKAFFCPYVIDMKPTDLQLPLSSFQAAPANRDGTLSLVQSINKAQGDKRLGDKFLDQAFNMWWPELEKKLQQIPRPETSVPKGRGQQSMIEEILETVRKLDRGRFSRTVRYVGPDTDITLARGPLALYSEAGETDIRNRLLALEELSRKALEQKAKDQETDANDKEKK
jgi:TIR domain-containing protein